ncbi:hypothetical protein D3C84_494080 [compost metagenome]
MFALETLHGDGALAVVLVQRPEGIGVVLIQVHLQVAAVAVLITLWRCVDGHDLILTQHTGRLNLRIDVRTTTRMGEQVHRAAAEDEDLERAWWVAIQQRQGPSEQITNGLAQRRGQTDRFRGPLIGSLK